MSAHPTRLRRRLLSAALFLMVLVPPLIAAPSASAHTHHANRTARESNFGDAVLRHINYERVRHNLRPVTMSVQLVRSAHRHNLRMAEYDELSHQLPGEAYFASRISNAGYNWMWAGENIAWNSQMSRHGVVRLQVMMYQERPPNDGHRLNILNSHYRNVGVDVYLDNTHHKVWLTTDFGKRR
jgi:uncharacterized protein YkwD